ncbi:unnamed protein product, partial [Ectocarpus sp. 13 AM-2016]
PEFVEVYDEPLHPTVFENEYVRVLKVDCPMNQDTMYHRHSQDSFFLFFRTAQVGPIALGTTSAQFGREVAIRAFAHPNPSR